MTWTKLGDEFSDETVDLTDSAFRAHVEALIWSNRKLADLIIPKKLLGRITAVDDPFAAAEELVAAGWWQDCGQTYYAGCRFPEWQMERAVVETRREQTADRVRRHRLHKAGDHSLCTERCSVTEGVTRDVTRDATRSPGTGRDGTGRKPTTQKRLDSKTENDVAAPHENNGTAPDTDSAHWRSWTGSLR